MGGGDTSICFEGWYKDKVVSKHKALPCTIAWELLTLNSHHEEVIQPKFHI